MPFLIKYLSLQKVLNNFSTLMRVINCVWLCIIERSCENMMKKLFKSFIESYGDVDHLTYFFILYFYLNLLHLDTMPTTSIQEGACLCWEFMSLWSSQPLLTHNWITTSICLVLNLDNDQALNNFVLLFHEHLMLW